MTNYNLAKIYKIVRKSDDLLLYVGSTCEPMLCRRLDKHKGMSKQKPNIRVYKSITDNGGWENHQILLIKLYPCNSRDELHSEESRFIRALNPIGNKNIPMRTSKDYYLDNCENIKSRVNNFRKENPEIIKERKRLERIKHIEKYQQYYIENKEKKNQKIYCCCGSTYTYQHKSNHFKSKKHINSIPVQFKLIEEMHKNRKQYIFPPLPTL